MKIWINSINFNLEINPQTDMHVHVIFDTVDLEIA